MEVIKLIDTHVHLEEISKLDIVLAKARKSGLLAIIGVGSDFDSNRKIIEISRENNSFVFPTLGMHPWQLLRDTYRHNLNFIQEHLDDIVALGEVGLDFKIKVDRELQIEVFTEILKIAKASAKPLIIHARGSWDKALRLVHDYGIIKAVFHWYSGPLDILEELLDNGYCISATPAAQYSKPHREALSKAPISQILLETDSPVAYAGKAAEPADIYKALYALSKIKTLPLEFVAIQTTRKANDFFDLHIKLQEVPE